MILIWVAHFTLRGTAMPDFCFFTKDNHVVALDTAGDNFTGQSEHLTLAGFVRQNEEAHAKNEQAALERFAVIRREQIQSIEEATTSDAFSSLICAILSGISHR